MKLKQLLTEDDAVSPVIGVILMVAITVILAAVIGTFVLGLGDRVSEAQPNANFDFEYGDHGGDNAINITHDGGDGVESDQLDVKIDGTTVWEAGDTTDVNIVDGQDWSGKITAGAELAIVDNGVSIDDGDEVQVIWNAPGSDKTAIIGDSEVSI